jgi:hypothetical protein
MFDLTLGGHVNDDEKDCSARDLNCPELELSEDVNSHTKPLYQIQRQKRYVWVCGKVKTAGTRK